MKHILIAAMYIAFCACGYGQMILTEPQPPDLSKAKFVLAIESRVPCGECNFTYAVACSPNVVNCGTPYKTIYTWTPFETQEKALKFLNDNPPIGTVRMFSLVGIEIEIVRKVKTIKHDDESVTITTYKAKATQ